MISWQVRTVCGKGDAAQRTTACVEGDGFTIGRAENCDLTIKSQQISRSHSRVFIDDNSIYVEDLGSTNGTWYASDNTWCTVKGAQELILPAKICLTEGVVVEIASVDDDSNGTSMAFTREDFSEREKSVAIMVLDLCSSTATGYAEGDIMAYHIKMRLNDIVRPVVEKHSQLFIKNTGDGFLLTFATADAAYAASRDIFAALQQRNSATRNPAINIRIALHFGRVYRLGEDADDIHGNDVNLTFRIDGVDPQNLEDSQGMSSCNNILCTRDFVEMLSGSQNHKRLGAAQLKGIPEPVSLYLLPSG